MVKKQVVQTTKFVLGSVPSKCYIYIFIKSSQYVYEALALLLLTRKLSTRYLLKTTQLISVKAGLQAQEFGSRMCSPFFLQLSLGAWVFTTSLNSFTDCSGTSKKYLFWQRPGSALCILSGPQLAWPPHMLHATSTLAHGDSGKRSWVSLQWPRKSHFLVLTSLLYSCLHPMLNLRLCTHRHLDCRAWFSLGPLYVQSLTWLDFLALKAWLAWLGFAVGFHNLTGVRLWTS